MNTRVVYPKTFNNLPTVLREIFRLQDDFTDCTISLNDEKTLKLPYGEVCRTLDPGQACIEITLW